MTEQRFPESFLAEIRRRTSLVELLRRDLALVKSGHEHKALCPFHAEKTPSFYVVEKKEFWHCQGCGAHGDAFTWLTRYHDMTFPDAVQDLAREAGLLPPEPGKPARPPKPPVSRPTAEQLEAENERERERAVKIWREAVPGAGTLLEAWFAFRGIDVGVVGGVPPSLRLAPALPYWVQRADRRFEKLGEWPAMVAGIQGADGRITGVHLTYLQPDGRGKAAIPPHPDSGRKLPRRKIRGTKAGGSIRFAAAGPKLVVGEGIESCMAARVCLPDLPVWSAVDLGNLVGHGRRDMVGAPHPERQGATLPVIEPDLDRPGIVLPDTVREVLLLGEADNGDPHAYRCLFERGARRFARLGLTVRAGVPPVGDFNDWLLAALGRAA